MDYPEVNEKHIELRKIQTIHGNSTFILVLPKDFALALNIVKGDYVKCSISENKLIVERVET